MWNGMRREKNDALMSLLKIEWILPPGLLSLRLFQPTIAMLLSTKLTICIRVRKNVHILCLRFQFISTFYFKRNLITWSARWHFILVILFFLLFKNTLINSTFLMWADLSTKVPVHFSFFFFIFLWDSINRNFGNRAATTT